MENLMAAMAPHLLELINLLIGLALSALALTFRRYTGVQVEEKHMRALHSALQSGAAAALRDGPGAGLDQVIERAVTHARDSVPEAIAALNPVGGVLNRIAERYVLGVLEKIEV